MSTKKTNQTDASNHPLNQAAIDRSGRREKAALRARQAAKRHADAMPAVAAADGPAAERVVDAELREPAPNGGVLGVIRQPYLLRLLVRREIAKMYSASLLGLFWSYVQPAIRFSTYYFVFGVLLSAHDSVPNYAIHLFCGIVFAHYFAEVFGGGTRSIWTNRQLVKKMALPREVFPISQMVVAAYHTFPQLLLLTGICLLSGWHVDVVGAVSGLLAIAIIATFAGAMALLFSAVNVYYRDFQNIVGTITQFMHFVVPMMYTYSRIEKYQDTHPIFYQLYMANPVANAVLLAQRFFWDGVNMANPPHSADKTLNAEIQRNMDFPPHMIERGVITLLACLVLLYFCQKVFTRLESKFPERL